MTDGYTAKPNDMTFRQLRLPRRDISAERDENYVPPEIESAAVELNDLTFRRLRWPWRDISAERDENYVPPERESVAVELNDLTFRRLGLLPGNVSTERDDSYGSPEIYCAAVELNDLTFRRQRLQRRNISAERDENYVSPKIDSVVVELIDLCFRCLRLPPKDFAAACDIAVADIDYRIFRRTSFPPNELPGGRNDDYIWLTSGSNQSVCARPVTGSLCSGHPHRLLSLHCLESVTLTPNCNCQTTSVRITSDIGYSHHTWCIEGYAIRSSITVILTVWYCVGVLRLRAMASDDWADREQPGPCQGRFWDPRWIYGRRVYMS